MQLILFLCSFFFLIHTTVLVRKEKKVFLAVTEHMFKQFTRTHHMNQLLSHCKII